MFRKDSDCRTRACGIADFESRAADRDDHRNNGRDRGKFDNRHNDSRGWDRNRGIGNFQPNYRDNRSYRRDRDNDVNWSVNLNIGARPFGYNPYGYNMLGYRPDPYSYRSRQPVVIYQNTYIEPSRSTTYIHATQSPNVSLLRDRHGML